MSTSSARQAGDGSFPRTDRHHTRVSNAVANLATITTTTVALFARLSSLLYGHVKHSSALHEVANLGNPLRTYLPLRRYGTLAVRSFTRAVRCSSSSRPCLTESASSYAISPKST
eukprot:1168682-Pleurochrysis_carterae.AAC.2